MDEKPFETMNVIPLVDIMMVLLVIVLTTSSFIASGRIPVNLPQASKSVTEADKNVTIEIDLGGDVYFNGRKVAQDELRAALAPLAKDTSFVIRADQGITLQRFVDVADLLKQMSFAKVAVQTKSGR
ncbi:MAG: biopolymer transporter ExbD [Acidobacteriota bacterium]|jgi:biopolymer transport protein ExbD|nr:biopolymer transporter ExbD [Acidobacteriota bacterium]